MSKKHKLSSNIDKREIGKKQQEKVKKRSSRKISK
jgi:hypothetical protein